MLVVPCALLSYLTPTGSSEIPKYSSLMYVFITWPTAINAAGAILVIRPFRQALFHRGGVTLTAVTTVAPRSG